MNDIKGIPYVQVRFDANGKRLNEPTIPAGTTDLIVVSHGWNNSEQAAQELYTKLFGNFADLTKGDPALAQRKVAILGVIWPAKKFDELMTHIQGSGKATGGAKSLDAGSKDAAQQAMREAIERAAGLFDQPGDEGRLAKLRSLEALVPKLEDDPAAQEQFVKTLREVIDRGAASAEQAHRDDGSDVLLAGQPKVIFQNATNAAPASGSGGSTAESPPKTAPGAGPADAAGRAAGFGSFFSKAANAVTNLLNLTTYFEMKQRAGTVGKNGVAPLIDALSGQVQRIHLVGHSFGGRVVTAAAASSTTSKLHSMSLLQAAFSHNGFSKKRGGFFRSVVDKKRIAGPILVTHTKNDRAVGLAYPAASRISGDAASGFGDADDKFGGIGSNGAQQMGDGEVSASAAELLDVRKAYTFQAGRIHNLKSDAFIVDPKGGDAHGFVFVPQVAWAISRAMLAG
jgi:hypothetical protein